MCCSSNGPSFLPQVNRICREPSPQVFSEVRARQVRLHDQHVISNARDLESKAGVLAPITSIIGCFFWRLILEIPVATSSLFVALLLNIYDGLNMLKYGAPAIGNSFGALLSTGPEIVAFLEAMPNDPNIIGVTCAGKKDGGGAQVLAVMSTLAYCETTGLQYFHTPFSNISFNDGADDWAGRWERFFNLGLGEEPVSDNALVLDPSAYIRGGKPKGTIIRVPHCHNFIHRHNNADVYTHEFREKLRNKYSYGPPKAKYRRKYIALHVRRGDVTSEKNAGRFTSNEQVVKTLDLFLERTNSDMPVHVLSQGKESDFPEISDRGVAKFHLDTDVFETIHRMVCAKGLIMGRSSFSYIAAILGTGEVVTDLWYHRPLSEWFINSEGDKILPWGKVLSYINRSRELRSKIRSDMQSVQTEIESDENYLRESADAKWYLSLCYLASTPDRALPLLQELAKGQSGFAEAASKTLKNKFPYVQLS